MIASGRRLIEAGASVIVVPCNTVHLWFVPLERELSVPLLHIVDAALDRAVAATRSPREIGLLATAATIKSSL